MKHFGISIILGLMGFLILFSSTVYGKYDDLFRDEDFFRVEEQLVITA